MNMEKKAEYDFESYPGGIKLKPKASTQNATFGELPGALTFPLVEVHVHTPSQHLLRSERLGGELHFVYLIPGVDIGQSYNEVLAVSVFIEGATELDSKDEFNVKQNEEKKLEKILFDFAEQVKFSSNDVFDVYNGSYTHFPCNSPGVQFLSLNNRVVKVPAGQLRYLTDYIVNRYSQPNNPSLGNYRNPQTIVSDFALTRVVPTVTYV
eukprot:GHVU01204918.1.p1 GENE.GHVU01204918.1~~GHVU01204918.1.p1  ORF type:complete len:209 (-),score=26.05 GHVU01204918.1:147-773(-)